MAMKKSRRKGDIKSKLVAAICMLMVSCIMVVSSTYAWFTLSTAPEVTGITTAIGANGNLEMALLPDSDGTNAITTVAAALNAIKNADGTVPADINRTWGNLVDLSNASYGLNKITLYPSKLSYTEGAEGQKDKLGTNYLTTPKYGTDGRLSGFGTSALAKAYKLGEFGADGFGVRAIGTSSGMSGKEQAYRNALVQANAAKNKAIGSAQSAVSVGGSVLANVAVKQAMNENPSFTQTDITSLKTTYAALERALDEVETALKQYIIADLLSTDAYDESSYAEALGQMEEKTPAQLIEGIDNHPLAAAVAELTSLKTAVEEEITALNRMTNESYAWEAIKSHITKLADTTHATLGGFAINKDQLLENVSKLVNNPVLKVNADGADTSGFYVRVANFVGQFTSDVIIEKIEYSGIKLENFPATIEVNPTATVTEAYLVVAKKEADTYSDGVFSGAASQSLSDFYGYIIDLAFRTNAADSFLQLQGDAVDRIYQDKTETSSTMGGGSTMSFTAAGTTEQDIATLKKLMTNIRVVLFNPENSEIYGYARLDMETTEHVKINGNEVTAMLVMWDTTNNKAAESQKIVELTQNKAAAVSVLVYLDGESVTNADVANTNLSGTMNLQFSSNAALTPMEYGDLRNDSTKQHKVYVNNAEVPGVTVENGGDLTLNLGDVTLPGGVTLEGATITVKVNGSVVDNAYDAGTKTITLRNVTGNVEITVTPANP